MTKPNVYFPNLNGLRFIAAFAVFIHHNEQLRGLFHLNNFWKKDSPVFLIGKLGVNMFFVLSGFLITYLLLQEIKVNGKINLKNFYTRRVLRIWPLYFFMVFLGFLVFPNFSLFNLPIDFHPKLSIWIGYLLYLLMFPNLVSPLIGDFPFISHLWSIGAEEQFYVLWPILIGITQIRNFWGIFSLIGIYLACEILLKLDLELWFILDKVLSAIYYVFNYSSMLIGCAFALVLFNKNSALKWLQQLWLFWSVTIILVWLIANGIRFPFLHFQIYSLLFGIVILNLASNSNISRVLEGKPFRHLGEISYGLYMYHPACIVVVINIFEWIGISNHASQFSFSFGLTYIVSLLSYRLFEKKILALKERFY
ncbi:MAG: acyltransferase [Flavobacteriales bacterium]